MSGFVWFWVALGAVLLLLELVVPGMVLVFLGVAAWIVAGLVAAGLITAPLPMFTTWFLLSLGLVVALRGFLVRLFPSSHSRQDVDEDAEAEDQIVDVVTDIANDHTEGRVRFGGTTWAARALDEPLTAGSKARLMYREDLVWVVTPAAASEGEGA
jgi:membrane protein implicated in regulation of membrane protease activity